MVPLGGAMVCLYMMILFGRKIKTKNLTPGLLALKEETQKMGKMTYAEYVTAGSLLLIVTLWVVVPPSPVHLSIVAGGGNPQDARPSSGLD